MTFRVYHVDMKQTNALLERQAVALESIARLLGAAIEVPEQPYVKPTRITAKDVGSYGAENESEDALVDRLRRMGIPDDEIERAQMAAMFGSDDEP